MSKLGRLVTVAALLAGCNLQGYGLVAYTSRVVNVTGDHYLVRFASPNAIEVFNLPPSAGGGALVSPSPWSGTLEILRPDCELVFATPLALDRHRTVEVAENGVVREIPAATVGNKYDGALEVISGRCGASPSIDPR